MITQFRVQNYKALRDVTLDLTPIHVLIGPNDSGKTSILEAIAALCRSSNHELKDVFPGLWNGKELVWQGAQDAKVRFEASVDCDGGKLVRYSIASNLGVENWADMPAEEYFDGQRGLVAHPRGVSNLNAAIFPDGLPAKRGLALRQALSAQYYAWNPKLLALPVAPDLNRRYRMEPSGFGLALMLDDILGYDRQRFMALEKKFYEVFPHVTSIRLKPEEAFKAPVDDPRQIPLLQESAGKGIYFQLESGHEMPAGQASSGMLIILAYLAVLHLPEPPRVLLIEEPENGIHPKRLQEVLKILRELVSEQSYTQVIMTTHSPYVVDLFKPEEVTLCRRGADGAVTTHRLSDSRKVREQIDVFTLGEIWTAEGDEALAQSDDSSEVAKP